MQKMIMLLILCCSGECSKFFFMLQLSGLSTSSRCQSLLKSLIEPLFVFLLRFLELIDLFLVLPFQRVDVA